MSWIKVPPEVYENIRNKEEQILDAYSGFDVTELPAGFDGEITEAYRNLIIAGVSPSVDNLIVYLRAKGKLMAYFRNEGSHLTDVYHEEVEEPVIAGTVLPEWVLSLQVILVIIVSGYKIIKALKKVFKGSVNEKEISQHAETIFNIKEVRNLYILTKNQSEGMKRKRKKKAPRKE